MEFAVENIDNDKQSFLGMSCAYIIIITSRRGWSIVRVDTIMVCWSGWCFQYQLVFSCMEQKYCALTTNSPPEINFPLIVVLFCSLYAYESNWMK